jgi:hypothetical protein
MGFLQVWEKTTPLVNAILWVSVWLAMDLVNLGFHWGRQPRSAGLFLLTDVVVVFAVAYVVWSALRPVVLRRQKGDLALWMVALCVTMWAHAIVERWWIG